MEQSEELVRDGECLAAVAGIVGQLHVPQARDQALGVVVDVEKAETVNSISILGGNNHALRRYN